MGKEFSPRAMAELRELPDRLLPDGEGMDNRGWGEQTQLSLSSCPQTSSSPPYWQGTQCGTVYRGQPQCTHRAGQAKWRIDLGTSRDGLPKLLTWTKKLGGVASAGTCADEPPRSSQR